MGLGLAGSTSAVTGRQMVLSSVFVILGMTGHEARYRDLRRRRPIPLISAS